MEKYKSAAEALYAASQDKYASETGYLGIYGSKKNGYYFSDQREGKKPVWKTDDFETDVYFGIETLADAEKIFSKTKCPSIGRSYEGFLYPTPEVALSQVESYRYRRALKVTVYREKGIAHNSGGQPCEGYRASTYADTSYKDPDIVWRTYNREHMAMLIDKEFKKALSTQLEQPVAVHFDLEKLTVVSVDGDLEEWYGRMLHRASYFFGKAKGKWYYYTDKSIGRVVIVLGERSKRPLQEIYRGPMGLMLISPEENLIFYFDQEGDLISASYFPNLEKFIHYGTYLNKRMVRVEEEAQLEEIFLKYFGWP